MSYRKKYWRLAKRDGARCFYCKKQLPYEKATIDHKHPQTLGGSNDDSNCVLACKPCNLDKADIPFERYIARFPRFDKPLGVIKADGTVLIPKANHA